MYDTEPLKPTNTVAALYRVSGRVRRCRAGVDRGERCAGQAPALHIARRDVAGSPQDVPQKPVSGSSAGAESGAGADVALPLAPFEARRSFLHRRSGGPVPGAGGRSTGG
nr:hypothetical protein [Tanacetum cinerariifolium]